MEGFVGRGFKTQKVAKVMSIFVGLIRTGITLPTSVVIGIGVDGDKNGDNG
jgi:hypothetical protein